MNKDQEVPVTHPSIVNRAKQNLQGFGEFVFNRDTREVFGRDGLSWSKVLGCYFVFYMGLATFFVGMFAIFIVTLRFDAPKYYGDSSVMSTRQKINPGLGFRPQLDPEDELIYYTNEQELNKTIRFLQIYLDFNYDQKNDSGNQKYDCDIRELEQLRADFRKNAAYCHFDYRKMLTGTTCDPAKSFGYADAGPCVLVKLNRIYDWLPSPYDDLSKFNATINSSLVNDDLNILTNNVIVKCDGEYSADRDALLNAELAYFSAHSSALDYYKLGLLPVYYYPYLSQPGYKSPLVFVQFKNLPQFQLVNIVCRAYAKNIDSSDKLNLRGMTKFQLFYGK